MKDISLTVFTILFSINISLSQHVGIGTENPTTNLHVEGDLKLQLWLAPFENPPLDSGYLGGSHQWELQDDDTYTGNYAPTVGNILLPSTGAQLYFIHNTPAGVIGNLSFYYKHIKIVPSILKVSGQSITPIILGESANWSQISLDLYGIGSLDTIVFEYIPLEDDTLNTVLVDGINISYLADYPLRITGAEEGAGKVLTSDELGNASWTRLNIDKLQSGGTYGVMRSNEFDLYAQDQMQLKVRSLGSNIPSITIGNSQGESSISYTNQTLSIFSGATIPVGGFNVEIPTIKLDTFGYTGVGLGIGQPMEVLDVGGPIRLRPYYDGDSTYNGSIWYHPNFNEIYAKLNDTIFPLSSRWNLGIGTNAISTNNGISTGTNSLSWGDLSTASHLYSTAWGKSSSASNLYATAWGNNNLAFGESSTVWGELNTVNGLLSTGWGKSNVTSSNMATAWGEHNSVSGIRATSWGESNTAQGLNSTAFGRLTSAVGNNSVSFGLGTLSNTFAEVAFGRFNNSPIGQASWWNNSDQVFSIGVGTSSSSRANAMTVLKNGNIGIGEDNPIRDLQLRANSAAKPTSSAWEVTSDKRLKKDITPFTYGLSLVNAINPVWFTYNGKANLPQETGVGTIAQELELIAPFMVKEWTYKEENGKSTNYKSIDYGALDFILINAVKELKEEIDYLKKENESLRKKIEGRK